jgi:hypothetical protein
MVENPQEKSFMHVMGFCQKNGMEHFEKGHHNY